ncbi:cyclase family protein [Microbacterium sp. Kw_RZR3]|uniref:cyclase family protein n=1 Tax=Microbacterium sp. Kw_RZR3 TaxID=3032903 RepID=UPI0023DB6791|nr:cyclase family protein [Microbacterium sp. Kw_RZR3]MDF2046459.1 cyclase family protein [Microbacterium sp. Kw_RZR3]
MTTAERDRVHIAQIEEYLTTLSNWGRWGEDDRLGTLNLITPEVRRRAAANVRSGTAISLARNLDPLRPDPLHSGVTNVQRDSKVGEVRHLLGKEARWDAVGEEITLSPHGGNAHLDGLGHYYWDGLFYNGFPASASNNTIGSAHLSVSHATEGIITRGVLLDIAGLHGVPYLERCHAVHVDELLEAERRQGVQVRSGDVLLIHTGNAAALETLGPVYRTANPGPLDGVQAGLDISCLPFLHDRDVAAMGADGTHDVQPAQVDDFDFARPIHAVSLVAMGLWLMDNLDLTALARACEAEKRWEFLFTALPWRFVGATSSPLNPVAVL